MAKFRDLLLDLRDAGQAINPTLAKSMLMNMVKDNTYTNIVDKYASDSNATVETILSEMEAKYNRITAASNNSSGRGRGCQAHQARSNHNNNNSGSGGSSQRGTTPEIAASSPSIPESKRTTGSQLPSFDQQRRCNVSSSRLAQRQILSTSGESTPRTSGSLHGHDGRQGSL